MAISDENRLICRMRNILDAINRVAVRLRDDIGPGQAVSVLHDRVQEIVDLTRSVNDFDHDEKLITRLTAERAELIEALRPFVYDLPYFGIRSDMDDVCRARALLERLGAKEVE